MQIPITLYVNGLKVETIALINSGATGIFIDSAFVKKLGLLMKNLPKKIKVFNMDGTENQNSSITKEVTADLLIKDWCMKTRFLETALGTQKVILGYPWLVEANPKINWRKRTFSWWDNPRQINIYQVMMDIQ